MKSDNVAQLRRELRTARRSLSPSLRARHSQALVRHLRRSSLLWPAHRIACFWPNDGEIDLRSLFESLWRRDIQVLLPVIDGQRLWFAPYTTSTPMRSNRFGIPEPALQRRDACPLLTIDVILMPLVAFDDLGNRVGMGGGYYDRTFANLRRCERLRGPLLIGTAFAFQRREQLCANTWDIPMHGVATEQGLNMF
jgi:5-formyltetrahydrofolate cyclo-ligase